MTDINLIYSIFEKHPLVCTDSRQLQPGSLFFALKGENFNGNLFALKALEAGAAYAVVDEPVSSSSDRILQVTDVLKTLQQLASLHRLKLNPLVLAVTGSNGKTTTKELIRAVLSKKFRTQATEGNLNNHIGVPLTLLSLKNETEMLIVEMGANHRGEIAALCEIASPGYGIITNIGKAHLEGFGGFEGVKKAKGELYDYLSAHGGKVFLNTDNPFLPGMLSGAEKTGIISYGTGENNDCTGVFLDASPFVSMKWKAGGPAEWMHLQSHLIGKYNFENILSAACVGNYFGVPEPEISKAVEEYTPSNNRSQVITRGSNTILLDAYNANPSSMKAALENFKEMKASRKVVVLGDMMELGETSDAEHLELVRMLTGYAFDENILVGNALGKYKDEINALCFSTAQEAGEWLGKKEYSGTFFLIKGSRKMQLEKAAEKIR